MTTTLTKAKRKIETVITAETASKSVILGVFLLIVSFVYGGLVKLRETLYKKGFLQSKALLCPVISIGNITVGGSGKTPMTIYLAEFIVGLGYRVTIINRGYKGKAEKNGGVVGDGKTIYMGSDEAGDEPLMIARRLQTVPVIVGQDRYKAGMLAIEKFNPDVILLDDGFQHLRIDRDINLVLLDTQKPFGNTYLFPRGTLREKPSALTRGDAVILTRSDVKKPATLDQIRRLIPEMPIFHSVHTPNIVKIVTGSHSKLGGRLHIQSKDAFDIFKNKSVFAFSGIARNDDFRRTIERFGCRLSGFSEFPDHHQYSDSELDSILNTAMNLSVDFIFTTEKDYIRLTQKIMGPLDLVIIGVEISFRENELAFKSFIKERLKILMKEDN